MSDAPTAPARRVVVVGGGASGTAAAFSAKGAGAEVTIVIGHAGATVFTSGALDGAASDLASPQVFAFVRALGIWELSGGSDAPGARTACVATTAGLLRPALGRDVNVLDLAELRSGVVVVPTLPRRGWDAGALAKSWTAEPWAVSHAVRFEPIEIDLVRATVERTMPDADLAFFHDDPDHAGWLADRLRASADVERATGVMLGPWLGVRRPLARELGRALGKPVGEPLSLPGQVAGLRFEHARDDLLARHRIARIHGEVKRVERGTEAIAIAFADGSSIEADVVVLATGGLAGGGIGWSGGGERLWLEQAGAVEAGFVGSAHTPAALAVADRPLGVSGSPLGAPFEAYAWAGGDAPAGLETAGIWTAPDGRARSADGQAIPWLLCAGDAVAGAPHTMLHALRSGLAAGLASAH